MEVSQAPGVRYHPLVCGIESHYHVLVFVCQLDCGLLKSVEAPFNRLHFVVQALASFHYSRLKRDVFAAPTRLLVFHKLE